MSTAAVPDPRFRDQLAEALAKHTQMFGRPVAVCSCGWQGKRFVNHQADVIAAEAEARAVARAQAELRSAAAVLGYRPVPASHVPSIWQVQEYLRDRADALDPLAEESA